MRMSFHYIIFITLKVFNFLLDFYFNKENYIQAKLKKLNRQTNIYEYRVAADRLNTDRQIEYLILRDA